MTEAEAILFKIEAHFKVVYAGSTSAEQSETRALVLNKIASMLTAQEAQEADVFAGITSVKAGEYSERRGNVAVGGIANAEAGGIALTPIDIVRKYATLYRKNIEVVE